MLLKTHRETSGLVDVQKALIRHAIAFEGPFRTSKGRLVFRVQDQVLLDSELLVLLESGQLTPTGIATFLRKVRGR